MNSKQDRYFIVQLFSRVDFSDINLLNFKREKNINLTIKEYSAFLTSNRIESESSRDLINFFIEYDNGALMPEKCDAYEPIKDKFNKEDISGPLRWLSQPGGGIFFRRTSVIKYIGKVENHRFAPLWQGGEFLKPKAEEPKFLGEIVLRIDIGVLKKKPSDYLFNLLKQLANRVSASYGLVALEGEYIKMQDEIAKIDANYILPGVFWINYFGPDYVSHFGEEKLNNISSICDKVDREMGCTFMVSRVANYNQNVNESILTMLGVQNFMHHS